MTSPALRAQARLVQAPILSPWLQHAVRLLQLSAQDYAQALHESAESNPFLEIEEAPADDAAPWPQRTAQREPGARLAPDAALDMLQNIPAADSLAAHLHAQLGVLRLSEEERGWAAAVVDSLDEDGYLRTPLAELAAALGWAPAARRGGGEGEEVPAALRTALRRVQSLEPAGVGARSVPECLALQLRLLPEDRTRALALRIVTQHIDLLAAHNLPRLAAALGAPLEAVRAAADCIRRLDPRPGWRYGGTAARTVVPDVVVRRKGAAWAVVLNEAALPRARLHGAAAGLYEQHRGRADAGTELHRCLERARWTVQNLAQRRSTIQAVAQAIVERQRLFFDYGPLAMKPLGLREIADAVGVHPSTVSRAAHEKYMATPFGVFELKYFFSRGLRRRDDRGASAPSAMKALIRELVAAEPQGAPLSDAELARRLETQGFRIARRTVTKYRQELKLAPFERRRPA
jgi:RNA polymerase sigma-54 factor